MKKFILTYLIFLFLIFKTYPQSGWIIYPIGTAYDGFNTLNFFNLNTGMVISGYAGTGYYGRLYKTFNGGQNWTYTSFNNPDNYLDGYYFDESNFILVGQRGSMPGAGIVAVYTNNIRTDIIIPPINGSTCYLTSTHWLDVNTGFIGGVDFFPNHLGRVLKTTNHGINWIEITPNPTSDVNCIKFFNINTGYIIDGSSLKKTTNSGQNWFDISNILLTQNEFNFITKDTCYICGYSGYVRISVDSGYTWQLRPVGYNINLRSIKFFNSKTGWVCGDSGYVFRTSNAGINWQKQNSGINNILYCINIIDVNNLWIGSTTGIVLKTTNGGVTFLKNNIEEITNSFELYQNYPNPFNFTTSIKYKVRQIDNNQKLKVILTVFNIIGKEINILVNKKQTPGTYELKFNGSNLPSGIYFYSFKIYTETKKIFSETKKLVLLK